MDLHEMCENLQKKLKDECKLQQYLKSVLPEKRNEPVGFSCNCSRCLPSM